MPIRMQILVLAALVVTPLAAKGGNLVIVGGGLSPDNADIYRAFIDRAKGGTIAIVPSASGEPQASADAFADNLVRHGVDRSRISVVRLAEVDDPATLQVNEADWASNASNKAEIARIEAAGGIWFTGGDQVRTMRLLTNQQGESPMLKAMRDRLSKGAVIGGTSAGAAIMGSGMIACGEPRRAGTDAVSRSVADCATQEGGVEPLVLTKGLGFLPGYVVDQHFSERGRLPRLVRAVVCGAGHGIGIDEDTALIIDLVGRKAIIIGKSSVTALTPSRAVSACNPTAFQNATLHQYRAGTMIKLQNRPRP